MAKKISELTSLATPASDDQVPINDISANTTKRTTVSGVHAAMPDGTVTPAKLLSGTGSSWVWQSWTPTWANLTIGNATVNAKYVQIGKSVHCVVNVTAGSTTSASGGAVPTFTLPVTSVSYVAATPLGMFALRGSAVGMGYARWASTTTGDLACFNVSGSQIIDVGLTEAIGSGDKLLFHLTYEAA